MQKNNHQLHHDFERGNVLVWIACAAAMLWLLLKTSGVLAAPFLVCDPQAGVETDNVYQDGIEIGTDIAAQPDGSLRYDLQAITPGVYNFTANACNVWGCSEVSDPFVSPAATSTPAGLTITP